MRDRVIALKKKEFIIYSQVTGLVIVGGTAYFLMSAPNSFGNVDQMDLIDNWDANHCRIFYGGDYKLFSYTTADTVTINTMK